MPGYVINLVIFVWLAIVSAALLRFFLLFRDLTRDIDKKDLVQILNQILLNESVNKEEIAKINKKLLEFEVHGKSHVQKIGLVRFNPFKELGGDHSFSLALLDGKDTGIIITGLHTRERTRVYIKSIKEGKSTIDLSNEEKKSLSTALKDKIT